MPTKEQVQTIISKIQRRVDFEFFMDNLNTPDWLEPLIQLGHFNQPEVPIREGDTVRFPFWPQARYLIKIAEQEPKKVMDVILKVPETENPRVHEDFVEATLKMPPGIAVQLHKSIVKWLRLPNLYVLLLPTKVTAYINHIRSGGFAKESLLVADALLSIKKFESKVPDTNDLVKRADPIVRSDWEYDRALKEISPSFLGEGKLKLIELLCYKLNQTILIEERENDKTFSDLSYIWRGSIEDSDQNHDYGIKDTIINWIRDLSEELLTESPDLVGQLIDKLLEKPFPIFSRFALHLSRVQMDKTLISRLVLDQKLFDSLDVWHEYACLIQAGYPILEAEDQQKLLDMIAAETSARNRDKNGSDIDEQANELSRYHYYYMIKDFLVGDEKSLFDNLRTKFGDFENPTFHSYTSSGWVGPTSPLSFEDLKNMSLTDLKVYLDSWQPSKQTFGPSIEGLGRELEKVVSERYLEFVDSLFILKLKEKTYVRSVIQGLSKLPEGAGVIKWEPILDYLLWASGQSDAESDIEFHPEDDKDPNWGWSRQAACRLIEKGLHSETNEIPFSLRGKVWSVLVYGISDPDPYVEKEDKYTTNKNYYQTAINTVRGEALDGIMHYALWVKRSLGFIKIDLPITQGQELFDILDKHLDINFEKSKAVRAMYGKWIPWLLPLNRDWFRSKLDVLLPKEPALKDYWAAALDANILYNGAYTNVFKELKEHYLLAIDRLELDEDDSWEKVDNRLLEHLISLYISGEIALDSEVMQRLYSKIDLKLKKRAVDTLGRMLASEKSEIEQEVIDRLIHFWNFRVEEAKKLNEPKDRIELSEFGWWMTSSYLEDEWVLDQAILTLNLCHSITPDHILMDRLVSLSEKFPTKVAEVFRLIVEHRVSDYGFYGWLDKAEKLLVALMKTEMKDVAVKIIHKLGAYGFNQFKGLLPPRK